MCCEGAAGAHCVGGHEDVVAPGGVQHPAVIRGDRPAGLMCRGRLGVARYGEIGKHVGRSIGQDVGFFHDRNLSRNSAFRYEVFRPARHRAVHIGGINAEQGVREVVVESGKSAGYEVGLLNRENLRMIIGPA